MIAVITGDIIDSRHVIDQAKWLTPLKHLFNTWGTSPQNWTLERGDFFQLEIARTEDVLQKALEIKTLIKKVAPSNERKKTSAIDVRLAIGIGEKNYVGETISESNGTAFIHAGEKFDSLHKEGVTIGIKTPWQDIDELFNLYLKLISIFMDKWTVSSAELMHIVLNNPNITQKEMGSRLGIKQSAVSRRYDRANIAEVLEVEKLFRNMIKNKPNVATH